MAGAVSIARILPDLVSTLCFEPGPLASESKVFDIIGCSLWQVRQFPGFCRFPVSGCLCLSHCLSFAGQVGHDSKQALDYHELCPVMYFMFFGPEQHLKAIFRDAARHPYLFLQKIV